MTTTSTDLKKLERHLKVVEEIKALESNLKDLDIKEIAENNQYKITITDNKEIYIENFTKIRYDFLDDVMRNIDSQEHDRIKEYTKTLIDVVLRNAKNKNEEDKIK